MRILHDHVLSTLGISLSWRGKQPRAMLLIIPIVQTYILIKILSERLL